MYNRYIPGGEGYVPAGQPSREESGEPSKSHQEEPRENDVSHNYKYNRAGTAAQEQWQKSGGFFSGSGVLDGLRLGKLTRLLDGDKSHGLGSLFSAMGLEELDGGDVMLLLIILLLLSEGDELELVITLGLMLLLGLSDKKTKRPEGEEHSGRGEPC